MDDKSSNDLDTKKLGTYLKGFMPNMSGPLTYTKFSSGQSNPTYLINSGGFKYVLRRRPMGKVLKSAHAIDREFRVLNALAQTEIPVGQVYHYCEDDDVIGSAFYVMEYLDGRVFWQPELTELSAEERTSIYDELNRCLARLHNVDLEASGLSDFGASGNFYSRQLHRWSKQYRLSETEPVEAMDTLIDWFGKNMVEDNTKLSLVHGDYRLDNVMFDSKTPQALAIMDWELSTTGHPFSDLAYQCMQWRLPTGPISKGLAGLDRKALGIPTEEEYLQSYCDRRGITNIVNWNFYLAFSFFRLAAILQGVKKRALDGNASSDKAHEYAALVNPLAEMGLEVIS